MTTSRVGGRPTATGDVDLDRHLAAPPSLLADVVAHVLHPVVVVAVALGLVGARAAGKAGLGWALLAWVLVAVAPFAVVVGLVRIGLISDAQVLRRRERGLPVAVGLSALVIGIVVLEVAGAPGRLVAVVAAQVAALLVSGLATLRTKVSFHSAALAAAAAVAWLELGAVVLVPAALAVVAVSWSRVRRGRHTTTQVVGGAGIGAVVTALVYGFLR